MGGISEKHLGKVRLVWNRQKKSQREEESESRVREEELELEVN